MRDRPLPASSNVRNARDTYLAENGFTVEEYDAKWTGASVFGIPIWVPNTRAHRRGIMLHDLHHVATGYGTDMSRRGGDLRVGDRGGLRGLGIYVGSIVMMGAAMGLLLAPRRTFAAYRKGRKNLFRERDYDALIGITVGELRARLGVPDRGLADGPQRLHTRAPAV